MQHLETCLLTAETDGLSFVYKRCEAFNCLFLLDAQNEIQLLARFLSYSWLVCLLFFWLRNAPLVKVIGIRFQMDRFYFDFPLLNAYIL